MILQVLMEQREELLNYDVSGWVSRPEEGLFEWGSNMAQVVIGVRRSGKSTLCHNALIRQGVKYAYANLDDDRLLGIVDSNADFHQSGFEKGATERGFQR